MSLFVLQSTSGIRKAGRGEYQSTTDDPCFVYRFWPRRPRFMVVLLQAVAAPLDPKIYADRGNGFDEAKAIALDDVAPGGGCIYSIAVAPPRRVARIRIDPCSSEARFYYWTKCAWTEKDRAAALAEAKQRAGGSAPVCDIVLDGVPEKRMPRRQGKLVAAHFATVVRLAERTAPSVDTSLTRDGPFISFVVPVHDTPVAYLNDVLASFRAQPAGTAELVLSDDGSVLASTQSWLAKQDGAHDVRVVRNKKNGGIAAATNAGIAAARGQWVGFLDHDDALTPGVVQLLAQTAQQHPACQFIYTDEVVTDAKLKPTAYFLKPAYDEVLLSGVNYINHLSCFRRERLLKLGGLRTGYDGSQDYDLLLRYLDGLAANEIKHLPYPGYRWRRSGKTYSSQFMDQATASARKALAERYGKGGAAPAVGEALSKTLHRVRFDAGQASMWQAQWPRVSIVIPNKDSYPLIARLLSDLRTRTDYPDIEIIVADNGTTDAKVLALYAESAKGAIPFRADIAPAPFNFSRQVNCGIARATGELVLLLNNDIEIADSGWLREMVSCFAYPGTGIVGAKLLYPNGRLQHAGVIVGLGGLAGHWFGGERANHPGPMARLHVRQTLTAVTGACMLVSRACLDRTGPFDEDTFAVAYNDVDFCLRAGAKGFRTVWTPFATLIHHESASRGSDEGRANRERFARDKEALRHRHDTRSYEDRAFSPWYSRYRSESSHRSMDSLPKAR